MQYAVVQIGSRQYLAKPGEVIEVDKLSTEGKTLLVDQVLLVVDGVKVEVGKPNLSKKLTFEVLGNIKKPKVRVATYKAKSNFRKVHGQKREMTRIRLVETK
ncbi:MAG: 50S ribosomal protein L21 [bacterium]|nr:50S ribosomal protein L21 [bacterium]